MDDESSDKQSDVASIYEDELFSFTFRVRGYTYGEFQATAKKCHGKPDIPVRIISEPDNVVDKNALAVQVQLDILWTPIGYIPKDKIPCVAHAMMTKTLHSVKICRVTREYRVPAQGFVYVPFCRTVKVGKWITSSKDSEYKYNDDLEKLRPRTD